MPFKVIQGHRFWYQSTAHNIRLPGSDYGRPMVMVTLWNRADRYIFMLQFVMAALCNRGPLCFCPVVSFYLSVSSSSFSSPNFSGRRLDVYHTSTHGVVLVRIQNACLKCAARGSLEMQHPKIAKNAPSGHHRTILSDDIFATKACIDNRKKTYQTAIPPLHVLIIR